MIALTQNDVDAKLREEFNAGVEKFALNPLHEKLRGESSIEDKMKFIPRMLFFVLGFKDLMEMVRYEAPGNELEKGVNTHSDEDNYHWKWYLNDLEMIDSTFNEQKVSDLSKMVWSDDSYEVRQTIYLFSRHIQNFNNPVARMLMIEVLELTFDKFKEALHPVLKGNGLFDKLHYFGKTHEESEEGHSTGISDDEIMELVEQLPEEHKKDMIIIVNQLFEQMYRMASNWAEA